MEYGKSFTYKEMESKEGNVVFSYPAGTGKTTACLDYIANHWKNEPLVYVTQTINSLNDFEQRLYERGVPREAVFNYNSESEEVKSLSLEELDKRCINSQIILITHSRLSFDSPYNYGARVGGLFSRHTLIIDESENPVTTVVINRMSINKVLSQIKKDNPEFEGFSLDESRNTLISGRSELAIKLHESLISKDEETGAVATPTYYKMDMSDGARSFSPKGLDYTFDQQVIRRLDNLYACIALQLVNWNFTWVGENQMRLTLPISIPETWYGLVKQIKIMDATGYLYMGYYKGFIEDKSQHWNWDKIKLIVRDKYLNPNKKLTRSLSKTEILKLTKEDIFTLLDSVEWKNHKRIYFVTFKGDYQIQDVLDETNNYFVDNEETQRENANPIMKFCAEYITERLPWFKILIDEQYTEEENVVHLTNYGRTRGSNAFRNCDLVVCFGNYRYSPSVLNNINICYKDIRSENLSLANLIQEIYRSQIRCDLPTTVYSFNDSNLTNKLLEQSIPFELNNKVEDEFIQLNEEERRIQYQQIQQQKQIKEHADYVQKFLTNPPNNSIRCILDCCNDLSYNELRAWHTRNNIKYDKQKFLRGIAQFEETIRDERVYSRFRPDHIDFILSLLSHK